MRALLIFVIVMFSGVSHASPQQKSAFIARTHAILPNDDIEMRIEPLFDPDFQKEHVSLFDDYGVKPIQPPFPPYLRDGQGAYEPDLDDEYY